MELSVWKQVITKASVGDTLASMNKAFGTNAGPLEHAKYRKSLNESLIKLDGLNLQVSFDYGKHSCEILYIPTKETYGAFKREHLDELIEAYGSGFRWLTHVLWTGTKHFFIYSRQSRILISCTEEKNGERFGPIRLARDVRTPLEYAIKKKSYVYRRLRYNFTNPDKFIDIQNTTTYASIPFAQVRRLLRKGITKIPTNTEQGE
ncbi:MAG: hypothetical protein ACSHX8_00910 [Opitutaceae bacterium]